MRWVGVERDVSAREYLYAIHITQFRRGKKLYRSWRTIGPRVRRDRLVLQSDPVSVTRWFQTQGLGGPRVRDQGVQELGAS